MRPFLPFAAVLTTAFLLGCQDQGSEPVGPDVLGVPFELQFDKKGTPGDDDCPGAGVRDLKGHCHGDGGGDTEVTWSFADARVDAGPGTTNTLPQRPGQRTSSRSTLP